MIEFSTFWLPILLQLTRPLINTDHHLSKEEIKQLGELLLVMSLLLLNALGLLLELFWLNIRFILKIHWPLKSVHQLGRVELKDWPMFLALGLGKLGHSQRYSQGHLSLCSTLDVEES